MQIIYESVHHSMDKSKVIKLSEISTNYYEKSKEKAVEIWYDYDETGGVCLMRRQRRILTGFGRNALR